MDERARLRRETLQEKIKLATEKEARRCMRDCAYWLQYGTKTVDETDLLNPNKPFPEEPFVGHIARYLKYRPGITVIYKSRTMMGTWLACGAGGHILFNNPQTRALVQSKDHDRSIKALDYIKVLWSNSLPALREKWRLSVPMPQQNIETLVMAEGGKAIAVAGGADKIRSEHPGVYIGDEAAMFVDLEDTISNIIHAGTLYAFLVTTARAGELAKKWEKSRPISWPSELLLAQKEESAGGTVLTQLLDDDDRKREEDKTGVPLPAEAEIQKLANGKVIEKKALVKRPGGKKMKKQEILDKIRGARGDRKK